MKRSRWQIRLSTCMLLLALAAVFFAWWKERQKATAAIADLPVSVTIKQRSSQSVPGAAGKLSLQIDDVTRGKVKVTVMAQGNARLLGPLSMKQGDSADFQFSGSDYSLKLEELNDALIGDDFASFVIDESGRSPVTGRDLATESDKIDRLIGAVETMQDAVFVRNGVEYPAVDAANHLRRKRDATKSNVRTAEDFVELVASRSSVTGEEYQIRFPDGSTTSARTFLRNKLATLEDRGEQPYALEPVTGAESTSGPSSGAIADLPLSITLKQRSTTAISGTAGKASIAIDDITGGQVIVRLTGDSQAPLLGPLSMKQGDSADFQLGGSDYSLKLKELNNELIGDDSASFVVDESGPGSRTEPQEIDHSTGAEESGN